MHIHFLDPYRPRPSLVHALDPRIKLVLAVAFILVTALTPLGVWPIYILLFSLMMAIVLLSELGIAYVLKRAALAFPFVLAALPLLVTVKGAPLATLPVLGWTLSWEGLERFGSIAVRSWISVQMAIVLAASTPFPDLLRSMRALRVPRLLVATFGLMWRYLFVLADEVLRMLRARAARSGHAEEAGLRPGGTLAWRARVAGGMAGGLFLRSFERGDRIYAAMIARGYDGETRTFPLPAISPSGWLILVSGLLVLMLLLGLSYLISL